MCVMRTNCYSWDFFWVCMDEGREITCLRILLHLFVEFRLRLISFFVSVTMLSIFLFFLLILKHNYEHHVHNFAQTLCLAMMSIFFHTIALSPAMFFTTTKILLTGEPHIHLHSLLPNAVPCHVSMSITFCLFLYSFFSCHSPLTLVTIIGHIAPPRHPLPISLFGCAVTLLFPLLLTISKFGLCMFFCCFC